jgi:hypothetical protein
LTLTQQYQQDLALQINRFRSKPLVVTEGKTDWIHLKTAFEHLKGDLNHNKLFEDMDIEFLESTQDMGDSKLCSLCTYTAMMKRDNPVIFIADADNLKTTKGLEPLTTSNEVQEQNKHYRCHGDTKHSKTYSFILPIPQHRKDTPLISIEHYYTDDQIKRLVACDDEFNRRLYMGGEFDSAGMGEGVRCGKESINKCGDERIDIIDNFVYEAKKGNTKNIALPKVEFANRIASHLEPFGDVDFESFIPVFKIIREILIDSGVIQEQTKEST